MTGPEDEKNVTTPQTAPLDRSLEEIENDSWGPPPEDSTSLVATVHRLRSVPIGVLGAEELRLLLSQNTGVDVLLPLAVQRLRDDPLAEGDYYPGDLLAAVLQLPDATWQRHRGELSALLAVLRSLDRDDPEVTDLDDRVLPFLARYASGDST